MPHLLLQRPLQLPRVGPPGHLECETQAGPKGEASALVDADLCAWVRRLQPSRCTLSQGVAARRVIELARKYVALVFADVFDPFQEADVLIPRQPPPTVDASFNAVQGDALVLAKPDDALPPDADAPIRADLLLRERECQRWVADFAAGAVHISRHVLPERAGLGCAHRPHYQLYHVGLFRDVLGIVGFQAGLAEHISPQRFLEYVL